jgi:hypothetical protein
LSVNPGPSQPPDIHASPAARVEALSALIGPDAVSRWCAGLLAGTIAHDDPDQPPLTWLGGPHAAALVLLPELGAHAYWPRVWGARGLRYAWAPEAGPAVVDALRDDAWRVREMAARVASRRELGEAQDQLIALLGDEVPRVRVAAARALARVGEAESVAALIPLIDDKDRRVGRVAAAALEELNARLDR